MKLTDITTSLELSKKLKELGFPQESLFSWQIHEKNDGVCDEIAEIVKIVYPKTPAWEFNYYAAPTAEELLEWLPERIEHDGKFYFLTFWKRQSGEIAVKYKPNEGRSYLPVQIGTLKNALAKMVIYLAKNKIINFER